MTYIYLIVGLVGLFLFINNQFKLITYPYVYEFLHLSLLLEAMPQDATSDAIYKFIAIMVDSNSNKTSQNSLIGSMQPQIIHP